MVSKRALLNFTSHGSPCPPRTFMITLRPVRFCLLTIVILILFTTCNTFQLENLSLISSFYPHVYISSEAIFLETFLYSLNPYLWPDLINSVFPFSTSSKYYAVSCLLTRVADPGSYYPDPDPTLVHNLYVFKQFIDILILLNNQTNKYPILGRLTCGLKTQHIFIGSLLK